ncbi:MAG: hypothetical protein JXR96_09090 [Deltaproteobacteria bacterium]|nr:hypothetical protein [Deltaproteobacteria bacterium]
MLPSLETLFAAILISAGLPSTAPDVYVPEPLRPWMKWVLHGKGKPRCPLLQGTDQRRCVWPTLLELDLGDAGGRFTQSWQVDEAGWVQLPGDSQRWPQHVRIDGRPAVVLQRVGRPAVRLERGLHEVSGDFLWDSLPESLAVPAETGLLTLTIRGAAIEEPQLLSGALLLRRETLAQKEEDDQLDIAVYRRISDEVPMLLETRIELRVSGRNREEVLGAALPKGFVPISIQGDLPAMMDEKDQLRIRLKAGTWVMVLTARNPHPVLEITRPDPGSLWPDVEIWVFDARPQIRHVSIEEVESIDPQTTSLPEEWRRLPAYAMEAGATMKFTQHWRGERARSRDRLELSREMWLDFDAGGYTLRDKLTGTRRQAWRLDARKPLALGRVMVDGSDVFITRGADGEGVELRRDIVRVDADSRIEGAIDELPVTGWAADFEKASAELHLPPGWRLLHASGVDRVWPTWTGSFSLVHLLLILIVSLLVWMTLGWIWGLVALLTLVLSVTEPDAPAWIWLIAICVKWVSGLVDRKLPSTIWARLGVWLRRTTFAVLAFLVLLFAAGDLQTGLFPVAAKGKRIGLGSLFSFQEMRSAFATSADSLSIERYESPVEQKKTYRHKDLKSFGQTNTGPGIPNWQLHNLEVSLRWDDPVKPEQKLQLVFLRPGINLVLALVRSGLLLVLLACVIGLRPWFSGRAAKRLPATLLPILLLSLLAAPQTAAAQGSFEPSASMLDELGERLGAHLDKPPDCMPTCASISQLQIELDPSRFRMQLDVAAAAATAIPLPSGFGLGVERVLLDGKPAAALARDDKSRLWVLVEPGLRQVVVSGRLPASRSLSISFDMLPHRVTAKVDGWTLEGLHDDGIADRTLVISRSESAAAGGDRAKLPLSDDSFQSRLPPAVQVQRSIRIGMQWEVASQVTRTSPKGAPIAIEVPLLAGEAVTTESTRVKDGRVLVHLEPNDVSTAWRSTLEQNPKQRLVAGAQPNQTEVWNLDVEPIYRVALSGIAPVRHFDGDGNRRIQWRPWPGEEVQIEIERLDSVVSQTVTVDNSMTVLIPGKRTSQAGLHFKVRSSRSERKTLKLPEGIAIDELKIDGVTHAFQQKGRSIVLPIAGGEQSFSLSWKQAEGAQLFTHGPAVDLGIQGVNATAIIRMPEDRWVLALGGSLLGPSVQFYGLLGALLLVSIGLGLLSLTPLRIWHWFVLGLGCLLVHWANGVWVAGMLLLLGWAAQTSTLDRLGRYARQVIVMLLGAIIVGLVVMTLLAGLTGQPEMLVDGNGSTATDFCWMQDRTSDQLPTPWVVSLPIWVFQAAMLVWGLWLVYALYGWSKWFWERFKAAMPAPKADP